MFSLALASVFFNNGFALRFTPGSRWNQRPPKGRQQERKSCTNTPGKGAPFEVRAGNQTPDRACPRPTHLPLSPLSAVLLRLGKEA